MLTRLAEVEIPRGGFIKYTPAGRVDFVSPLPCPFNYGCIPDETSEDGDPLDAVILGPRLPRGTLVVRRAWGRANFIDAGEADPKVVLSVEPPTAAQWATVEAFFRSYAWMKGALNRSRGRTAATRFEGIERP